MKVYGRDYCFILLIQYNVCDFNCALAPIPSSSFSFYIVFLRINLLDKIDLYIKKKKEGTIHFLFEYS